MSGERREILYVEDDPADMELIHAAKDIGWKDVNIIVLQDGEEAISYANGEINNQPAGPRPDVILLDLNLPKIHGKEVLKAIKQNESLREIPVFIVTTSSVDSEVSELRTLGANAFFTKPASYNSFKAMLTLIRDYVVEGKKLPFYTKWK